MTNLEMSFEEAIEKRDRQREVWQLAEARQVRVKMASLELVNRVRDRLYEEYLIAERERVIRILNEFRREIQKPGAVINVETIVMCQSAFADQILRRG